MSDFKRLLVVLSLGLYFSLLFFKQTIGLNLALYEIACFGVLLYFKQLDFKNKLLLFSLVSQGISLIYIIFNNSSISIVVHTLFCILSIGIIAFPSVKSTFYASLIAVYSILCTPYNLLLRVLNVVKHSNTGIARFGRFKYYFIPVIIVLLFIVLYRNANANFNQLLIPIDQFFSKFIPNIFEYINVEYVVVLVLGIVISAFLFIQAVLKDIKTYEDSSSEYIIRKKSIFKTEFSSTALSKELKAGLFLLMLLNLLLLLVNCLDIYWVWFNFKWDGEYLKQFVHEGTYLLLISIILSAIIVMYFFRNNQNFFKKSKLLKQLSYIWIAQNIILCISVGIRNYWYIDYFNLAYKRIGVYVFLILVIYGLYTIYLKVKRKHSNYFLIRKNSFALLLLLLITSLFNWDVIIAKYNFRNANHAFVHFDFLSELSPKALPYYDKSLDELRAIEKNQKLLFLNREAYMSADEFYKIVRKKRTAFLKEYAQKDWLSWNYSDYNTAKKLTANN